MRLQPSTKCRTTVVSRRAEVQTANCSTCTAGPETEKVAVATAKLTYLPRPHYLVGSKQSYCIAIATMQAYFFLAHPM